MLPTVLWARIAGVTSLPINAGWRISEEEFIEKHLTGSWLDDAKIRASWGLLGNDVSVPQFMYPVHLVGNGDQPFV